MLKLISYIFVFLVGTFYGHDILAKLRVLIEQGIEKFGEFA